MYHLFLIHSSVEGHLGCLQVLAMTNNAALNIVDQCPCGRIEHPLVIYPKVVLLDLRLFPNFLRNCCTDFQSSGSVDFYTFIIHLHGSNCFFLCMCTLCEHSPTVLSCLLLIITKFLMCMISSVPIGMFFLFTALSVFNLSPVDSF